MIILAGCSQDSTATASTTDAYRISYEFTLITNNAVGNEWSKEITCNGQALANGQEITADGRRAILWSIIVAEEDIYPDIGHGEIALSLQNGSTASTEITVCENMGRYQGNRAVWKVTCTATAV